MGIHWNDILSTVGGLGGAAAAAAAWRAAQRSNDTADSVARIEHDRWHTELTPQFEITATYVGLGVDRVSLRISLTGPSGLPGLDAVTVKIRDDGYVHLPLGRVTQEMIDAQIYGPYQFEAGIDGASADGRTVTSRPLGLNDWDKFSLRASDAPDRSAEAHWRTQYEGEPIRVVLECHLEGHRPWYIAREVTPHDPTDPGA